MINDSGRPGNRPCFLNAMVGSNGKVIFSKSSKTIYLHISEESFAKRLDRFRGHSLGSVQQLQGLHTFTAKVMRLNQHSKDACEGSNRGNVVGPLAMDDYDNGDLTWRVVVQEKFEILGRLGARIPVGGMLSYFFFASLNLLMNDLLKPPGIVNRRQGNLKMTKRQSSTAMTWRRSPRLRRVSSKTIKPRPVIDMPRSPCFSIASPWLSTRRCSHQWTQSQPSA